MGLENILQAHPAHFGRRGRDSYVSLVDFGLLKWFIRSIP